MLSETTIKEALVMQRETILQRKYGIEREVLREIAPKVRLPHVVVLTGLRRSGKSTVLRQLMKKAYDDEDFYYVNFEDERLFNFPAAEFNRIYEALLDLYGKKRTFFLDEVQNVPRFETFVRRFYEDGCKFFITGSSATLLSRELGTKLTGRHVDIVIKPFSFPEFLALRGAAPGRDALYSTETRVAIKKHFEEYLAGGGMPEYAIYHDPELLTRVYEDTILKDIAVRHRVGNVALLRELYAHLLANVGNRFSYTSLKKLINIGSVNTVKKFIGYLEDTYFAKTIPKFDYSQKKRIINDKKFYVVDNGFISVLSSRVTKDHGWLLENAVFNSLTGRGEVLYHAESKECDFLVVKNKTVMQTVQVCYELHEGNRERELAGLQEAMDRYKLKAGLVVTNAQEEELAIHGKKVLVKPAWKWLLEQ